MSGKVLAPLTTKLVLPAGAGPPKGLICEPLVPKSERMVMLTRSVKLPSGSSTATKLFGPSRVCKVAGWPITKVPAPNAPLQNSRCRRGFQHTLGVLVVKSKFGGVPEGWFTHLKLKSESNCATKMSGCEAEREVNGEPAASLLP